MEFVSKIITNILIALYQPFWFVCILSFLGMYLYLYAEKIEATGQGYKNAIKIWIKYFKNDKYFRINFFLLFYCSLILFRTLLLRDMWLNPLANVMGGWSIYVEDPNTGKVTFTTEGIENIILFIPFTVLFMLKKRIMLPSCPKELVKNVINQMGRVFVISCGIEFTQLVLRVGTFQISDLVYNTIGATCGAALYYIQKYVCMHVKKI